MPSNQITKKKVKCASTDCDVLFIPVRRWQKFHDVACKNREAIRRLRAKLKAKAVSA